jgi:predicted outer membrane repeat protein
MHDGEINNNEATGSGGGVWVDGAFYMEGGTISDNTASTLGNGGGVYIDGDFVMHYGEISDNEAGHGGGVFVTGTFEMNDGEISGNANSEWSAGGVHVIDTFEMNGGTISNNTSEWGSGGVFVEDTFVMNDGIISYNEGTIVGGVYIEGNFVMNDGTISFNTSEWGSGGVLFEGNVEGISTFDMYGGTISFNTGYTGGVLLRRTNFTMQNGYIKNNTGIEEGGGIHAHTSGTSITIKGGIISENKGVYGGGIKALVTPTKIKGGYIINNTATQYGGGIYAMGHTRINPEGMVMGGLTISGGTISGNEADGDGGGIFIITPGAANYGEDFIMKGGTISNNTATNGGGVALGRIMGFHDVNFIMLGGEISENTAELNGGGVYLAECGNKNFTMNGGEITDNTAADGGGIWVDESQRDALTTSNTAIFHNNVATNGATFNDPAQGIENANYPNIEWDGANSVLVTHLFNNFDVNDTVGTPIDVHKIEFSVVGANGEIGATVDDVAARRGSAFVEVGKDVVFTGTPVSGFRVREWTQNGTTVAGNTTRTFPFTIPEVSEEPPVTTIPVTTVTVEFEEIPTNGDTTGGNNWGGGGGGEPPVEIIELDVPLAPFIGDHIWYVRGFPDGEFKPANAITRAEIAMMLWRLIDSDAKDAPQANRFEDVRTGSWYAQAVNYLASGDILRGYEDGTFRPNNPITRAELTAVMSRFFEIEENGTANFSDVDSTHWAVIYINNAHSRGWIEGFPDGTFRPNNATNRAEAVTLINRVIERVPNPVTINYQLENYLYDLIEVDRLFTDITNAHWAFYHIMEAAIEHDFDTEDGLEVWTEMTIPWFSNPRNI